MQLMRYRDENGKRWADVIDRLATYGDARRRTSGSGGEGEVLLRIVRRLV
jgi:hypothetical protein